MSATRETELHGSTRYEVDQLWDELRAKIDPWQLALGEGAPFETTRLDGRIIRLQGSFEGSAEAVFWGGYIEPFMKAGIVRVLTSTSSKGQSTGLGAKQYIDEAVRMLRRLIESVYERMAEVDYRLRTPGHQLMAHPPVVTRRDTTEYVERMQAFLDKQAISAIAQAGPRISIEALKAWIHRRRWMALLILCVVVLIAVGQGLFDLRDLFKRLKSLIGAGDD